MNRSLKARILANSFVDSVRISMTFDQIAYEEFVSCLNELASALKGRHSVDRELMLYLYSAPVMVRNAYLSFSESHTELEITNRLEDAWVELDRLITNCLYDENSDK